MSRTIIGGLVAILIAALTAVVYIIVTSSLPAVARREARETVARAPGKVLGAVVVGQPLGRGAAAEQAQGLGTEAAYVDGNQVYATSQPGLQEPLGRALSKIGPSASRVSLAGEPYLAMAVPLPRIAS